jgi:hypothetical protein
MTSVHQKVISQTPKAGVRIDIKNWIGQKCIKAGVRLTRIDDLFYSKPIVLQARTSNGGYVHFDPILEGVYLAEIISDNVKYEQVIEVKGKQSLVITVPTILGVKRKIKQIDKDELKKVYEKNRTDMEHCFLCRSKYEMLTDRFLCTHCNKYYCEKHSEIKKHECWVANGSGL